MIKYVKSRVVDENGRGIAKPCPICKKQGVTIQYNNDPQMKMAFMCCKHCDFFVRGWAKENDREAEYADLLKTWNENNKREISMYYMAKAEDELYNSKDSKS